MGGILMALKSIGDKDLVEGDAIKYRCERCNKNVVMKIMFAPEGMLGKCCSCKSFITLKKNENYISEIPIQNVPKCPTCGSVNIKKITLGSRAVKTAVFGVIGAVDDAGKTYKCGNCGSKF
jgi:hypothetical protein